MKSTYENICTSTFFAPECPIAKHGPTYPSTDDWKMWNTYTMKSYTAIKKNEILCFARKWMQLKIIMFSRMSQSPKTNIMFLFVCLFLICTSSYTEYKKCNACELDGHFEIWLFFEALVYSWRIVSFSTSYLLDSLLNGTLKQNYANIKIKIKEGVERVRTRGERKMTWEVSLCPLICKYEIHDICSP